MQRKANRLLLLLIGTALAACSSTSEQGSSGIETEPEIIPSTVQPPPPELEPVQYTEPEEEATDLGPVDYTEQTITYSDEYVDAGDTGVSEPEEFYQYTEETVDYAEQVSTTADTGVSEPMEFPDDPMDFPVTTYEMPADQEVADLGPIDQPVQTLSYQEEIVSSGDSGVSEPEEYYQYTDETVSYDEQVVADAGDTGVSAPEEFADDPMEFPVTTYTVDEAEEIGDLGPVDTSNEVLSYEETPVYQEETVGAVTNYQSVTVNAEARPLFAFDKADVASNEQYKLESFVSELAGAEYETIWVVGHADRIGSVEYNQGLSERRAGSVKAFLVRLGIEGTKINTSGHSELMPVTTESDCKGLRGNSLIDCLQPDRRVEVSVSAEVIEEMMP